MSVGDHIENGWGVYNQDNGDVIVMPLNDIREHDMHSKDCPCMPQIRVDGANMILTHNAFDFRHVMEWLREGGDK